MLVGSSEAAEEAADGIAVFTEVLSAELAAATTEEETTAFDEEDGVSALIVAPSPDELDAGLGDDDEACAGCWDDLTTLAGLCDSLAFGSVPNELALELGDAEVAADRVASTSVELAGTVLGDEDPNRIDVDDRSVTGAAAVVELAAGLGDAEGDSATLFGPEAEAAIAVVADDELAAVELV